MYSIAVLGESKRNPIMRMNFDNRQDYLNAKSRYSMLFQDPLLHGHIMCIEPDVIPLSKTYETAAA